MLRADDYGLFGYLTDATANPPRCHLHARDAASRNKYACCALLAKIEHRDVKQSFLNQVKHIDDSPCSAIAVIGWMNRLELMVYQCHLDQWVAYAQNSTNLGIRCAHVKKISICEHLQINKPADYLLEFAKLARLLGMSMRLIVRE